MQTATLVIALFGAVTGGLSLAWAVRSFYLSGARVTVRLEDGRMGSAGVIVHPAGTTTIHPGEADYAEAVLVVTASNSGRLPVAVTNWQIQLGATRYMLPDAPHSPTLPHTLGVGEEASWLVPLSELRPAFMAVESTIGPITELRATVRLANGKIRQSDAHPPLASV